MAALEDGQDIYANSPERLAMEKAIDEFVSYRGDALIDGDVEIFIRGYIAGGYDAVMATACDGSFKEPKND